MTRSYTSKKPAPWPFDVDGARFVAGGGISPITGLRVGAGFAHGAYRRAATAADGPDIAAAADPDALVFNLEAEYAVGHTRFGGEWVRNRFDSALGPAIARGYFVQAVHTFSPRLFGTARLVSASRRRSQAEPASDTA